jgi:threonylcarbamoyladenosine tRNA methylthiotransferase MtaB
MSGCTAGITDAERLFEAGVDVIVGKKPGDLRSAGGEIPLRLGGLVSQALAGDGLSAYLPRFSSTRASIKVQDGCSFRCAYCIVPDARGDPRSRPFEAIMREVEGLAAQGYREVVLTGVNVACWHDADRRLADLAEAASRVAGVARIRLSSVEPGTTERAIVDRMAVAGSRLCHTLHYPLQSGDAGVLKRMRRRYTPEQYGAAVEYALGRIPRLGLGADVITGFPGEDDAAFQETVRMVERYPFGNLHVFPYSERPGTPAAEMDGKVPVAVRRARARELIAIANGKREAFASSFMGLNVEVLIEGVDGDGVGKGWTSEYVEAHVSGLREDDGGRLVEMKVASAKGGAVYGRMCHR